MGFSFDDGRTSTFGRELMNYISSRLPYVGYDLSKATDELNPKYKYFETTGTRRAEVLSKYSVSQNFDFNNQGLGSITSDKQYSDIMYANIQKDKGARIRDYRIIAAFSEVADALDEICDEVINKDANGDVIKLRYKNIGLTDLQQESLNREFSKYIQHFELDTKGWDYFRQLLIEGEVYFEHIIHEKYPKEGILGAIQVPTELIDPVFSNVQNVMVKGYLYRKPKFDPRNPTKQVGVDYVPLDKNQVTYMHSNIWNENRTMRLPFIENCRRAYRQLSMIEDSIVIYRLVRAPERLVFNVDVGNMPAPKAEAYLRKLQSNYWSSKTFDSNQGGIVQKFNPQSMLDSFWFAKRAGSEGTNVTSLPGGCLAMDTLVPLWDGRTLSIQQIEQELKTQKKLWVYSTNPVNGHIAPGLITWAGVTQESAQVMKLKFSNGKEIICTLDHKFPILGKGKVQAQDLVVGETMIALHKDTHPQHGEIVYQNDTQTWEPSQEVSDAFFSKNSTPTTVESTTSVDHVTIDSIEYLEDHIEVGTLTIDNEEKYHDYHTFALDCGVFTHNSNLGQLEDLMYFMKKLYKSLKVPVTRLDPNDAFRDGQEMLREELKFARFIIRLQQNVAAGFKNGFITHLQLKGLWDEFKLKEHNIDLEFNVPTNFYELRESQKLELKIGNYSNMSGNEYISPTFAQKKYLGWTDVDIKANREFLRKDKALRWELAQIENAGPEWKEAMAAQAGAMGGEMGPEMGGGGGGGGAMPPPFVGGPAATPEMGGEAGVPPEAGAPPEAGPAPAPEAGPPAE